LQLSLALEGDLVNIFADACARGPAGVVEAAASRALGWLGAPVRRRVRARSGAVPVLFAPEAVTALLDPLVLALDGLEAALGTSPLASALGAAVLDPRLSLIDDGLHPDGVASSRWDGEGSPRQRTQLIARGELRSCFHDLRSAALAGTASTGNAVRRELLPAR